MKKEELKSLLVANLSPLNWDGTKECKRAVAIPLGGNFTPYGSYNRVSYFIYDDGSFCVSTRGTEFQVGPSYSDIDEAKKAAERYHVETVLSLFKTDEDVQSTTD